MHSKNSNPKKSTQLYTYELAKLKAGDIILSTTDSEVSRAIRIATSCDYSHAMIYTRNSIIHADGDGVFTTNPQRRLFKQGQSIVLRHKTETPTNLNKVCQHALNLSGSLYSISEALLAQRLSNTDKRASNTLQYCSRLVAQSYESQNIKIVNNSDFCTPADILKSEVLELVQDAIRQALPEELDIANTPDTVKIHQTHTFAWLKEVKKIAKSKRHDYTISTIKSAIEYVATHPDMDRDVYKKIKASGYLKDYNLDKIANPHRYKVDVFLKKIKTASNPLDVIQQEAAINNNVFENAESHLYQLYPYAKQYITYNKLANMHLERMEQVAKRIFVLLEICELINITSMQPILESTLSRILQTIETHKN